MKKKIGKILLIFFPEIILIAGCGGKVSTAPLTPEGQKVQVTKAEPPPGCVEVGLIEAISGGGCGMYGAQGTYEDAYNILRNKAAEMGANHVRMDSQIPPHGEAGCFDNRFVIRGVAFRCP